MEWALWAGTVPRYPAGVTRWCAAGRKQAVTVKLSLHLPLLFGMQLQMQLKMKVQVVLQVQMADLPCFCHRLPSPCHPLP